MRAAATTSILVPMEDYDSDRAWMLYELRPVFPREATSAGRIATCCVRSAVGRVAIDITGKHPRSRNG